LQGSHHSGDGAENSGLRARGHRPRRRRFGKQAAIIRFRIAVGRALEGAEGGQVAVEGSYSGEDQRPFGQIAGVVDQIARGEIVGAVGDDVVIGDDLDGVLRLEPRGVKTGIDVRVQALDALRRASRLVGAGACRSCTICRWRLSG
jgi:hypothetical protein